MRAAGCEPRLEILAHGLVDEETAFRVEAAVIDTLGLGDLTNEVRGWRSVQMGRMLLEDIVAYYAAEPVKVAHPALLIRINKLYRHGMSALELYEVTRGVWKLSERRERVTFAMAVFEGVVREVYRIHNWHPAGTTPYQTRSPEDFKKEGRWEFVGERAEEGVRGYHLLRSVAACFKKGMQSPVVYAGADTPMSQQV